MNDWLVEYTEGAKADLKALDNTQRQHMIKAIRKVSLNPLPISEGGYGKPLGNHASIKLAGCCKIKLVKMGLRAVYKVIREAGAMRIIVIASRSDETVYREAEHRIQTGE